jgi:hypothetical protein
MLILLGKEYEPFQVDNASVFRELFPPTTLSDLELELDKFLDDGGEPNGCKELPDEFKPIAVFFGWPQKVVCFDTDGCFDESVEAYRKVHKNVCILKFLPPVDCAGVLKLCELMTTDATSSKAFRFYACYRDIQDQQVECADRVLMALTAVKQELGISEDNETETTSEDEEAEESEEVGEEVGEEAEAEEEEAEEEEAEEGEEAEEEEEEAEEEEEGEEGEEGEEEEAEEEAGDAAPAPPAFLKGDAFSEVTADGPQAKKMYTELVEDPHSPIEDLCYSSEHDVYFAKPTSEVVEAVGLETIKSRKTMFAAAMDDVKSAVSEATEAEVFCAWVNDAGWMGFRRSFDGVVMINLANNTTLEDFKVTIVHELCHKKSDLHGPVFLNVFQEMVTKLIKRRR